MFCPECGSKISDEVEYCPNYGEKLGKAKNLLKETPSIEKSEIPIKPIQKTPEPIPGSWSKPRPSGGINQVLVFLVIFALIGLILMISGIVTLFRGGLSPTTGISLIVVGIILLSIGTKARCLVLPFFCACDDCDC